MTRASHFEEQIDLFWPTHINLVCGVSDIVWVTFADPLLSGNLNKE